MASTAIIKQGICSWTDAELIKRYSLRINCGNAVSGKFFPTSANSSEDRLSFYSGKFPCVEVDMSTYVIPNQSTCEKWAKNTVPGFLFHFKIFQFFTSQVIDVSVLPIVIQNKLSPAIKAKGKLTWDDTNNEMRDELWGMYNEALRPVYKMGKLGVVLFQFQMPFEPCERTRLYLQECRARLAPEYIMAVEFRNLDWLNTENLAVTIAFCSQHRLVLTCARNRHNQPAPAFQPASFLIEPGHTEQPRLAQRSEILLEVTNPVCVYIRVHRRSGDHRLLSEQELTAWADRLRKLVDSGKVTGSIYITWNTHHENQAILNPLALAAKMPSLCYDWKTHVSSQPGRLDSFFARKTIIAIAATPAPAASVATAPKPAAAIDHTPLTLASRSTSSDSTPEVIEIIEYDDDPDMVGFYTSPKVSPSKPGTPKKHAHTSSSDTIKPKPPAAKRARSQKLAAPDAAVTKQQTTLSSFFQRKL